MPGSKRRDPDQTSDDDVVASAPKAAVTSFLTALAEGDLDAALDLVDDDLVYENVSLPTVRGKRRFAGGAKRFYQRGLGFEYRMHLIAEDGDAVLTERTDAITWGRFRSQFWVCGRFEVVDGTITLWRDYFDWQDIILASLRGLVGIALPSVRATLDA